jgi:microcin C transport system substrate-binding protein
MAVATISLAETFYPSAGWVDAPDPIADPNAVPGGEIIRYGGPQPKSLNYYLDANTFSLLYFGSLYETLLDMDPVSADYVPGLADRWSISDDKMTFTLWLDARARWSDGTPVTAEDVLWTFNAILNPTNLVGAHKVALETFKDVTVVPSNGIRFTAREVHWRNLGAVGGFHILPRHVLATQDFNKVNFDFPVVSGPYMPGEFKGNAYAKLSRRPGWWRTGQKRFMHVANFQTVTFRFFDEPENAFEAFKKGQMDVYPIHMARLWVNDARGEKFDRNWIVKQRVYNHNPIGFQGFAMNMRRPPFDDRRAREAMACLLDREHLNQTLMYGQYFLHRSYYEDLYDKATPCPNPVARFDKDKARSLLSSAGWAVNAASGFLEKNGKPFSFRFLTHDQNTDRYLARFAEDLKSLGIQFSIDRKDRAAWQRDMDKFNYDMTWAAWSAGIYKDPEYSWSSREAVREEGNNITGFRSESVDELIEKQRGIFDVAVRHELCRKIDAILAAEYPYILLWNLNYERLAYWNKFGMPRTVLSKYGDADSLLWYWWYDPDAAEELAGAMKAGKAVPARPAEVVFDDVFGKR